MKQSGQRHLAVGIAAGIAISGAVLGGTAHADPPGQSVANFGQCVKAGIYDGANPDPQSDPGGLGPTTTNKNLKLRGPIFASFKGEFPFDDKTPFEAADACPK